MIKLKEIIKESGLKMTILEEGQGPRPTSGQKVLVHYGELFLGEV